MGKSTLLNRLTGAERSIVSPIPGTTRDAVDEIVEHDGRRFRFIDTAGIRRKGKTHLMAEKLSVVMARKHLEAADIALLVIDATEGVSQLDATIAGYAHESGRSMIIIVNKWDLVISGKKQAGQPDEILAHAGEQAPADRNAYEERLRDALKFLSYAPVLFVSASTGKGTEKIFPMLEEVATERRKRIGTGEMNRFLKHVDFERASVPARQQVRIYYMTQAAVGAADVRPLHRSQSEAALRLPALSGKPDSQSLRICGHADLDQEPRAGLGRVIRQSARASAAAAADLVGRWRQSPVAAQDAAARPARDSAKRRSRWNTPGRIPRPAPRSEKSHTAEQKIAMAPSYHRQRDGVKVPGQPGRHASRLRRPRPVRRSE